MGRESIIETIKHKSRYKHLAVLLICILLFTYYISDNWYQLLLIHGESMSPSYHNMQFVIMDRHSNHYTYGDAIVFQCDGLDSILVKRIVACPGDEVIIKNRKLYVNGKISVVFSSENTFECAGIAKELLFLGEKQYFVIGDNISQSKDSRYTEVGFVDATSILGIII